jgi:hypothetical protein
MWMGVVGDKSLTTYFKGLMLSFMVIGFGIAAVILGELTAAAQSLGMDDVAFMAMSLVGNSVVETILLTRMHVKPGAFSPGLLAVLCVTLMSGAMFGVLSLPFGEYPGWDDRFDNGRSDGSNDCLRSRGGFRRGVCIGQARERFRVLTIDHPQAQSVALRPPAGPHIGAYVPDSSLDWGERLRISEFGPDFAFTNSSRRHGPRSWELNAMRKS